MLSKPGGIEFNFFWTMLTIRVESLIQSKMFQNIIDFMYRRAVSKDCQLSCPGLYITKLPSWSHLIPIYKVLKSIRSRFKEKSSNYRLLFILHKACHFTKKKCTSRLNALYIQCTCQSDSQMVNQRTPLKPNSLTYLKNFYPNFFPKNCKMLDPGTI